MRRVRILGALAVAGATLPASASAQAPPCEVGSVRTFATIPNPGHPSGIAVHDGRVYVATTNGNEFHVNADGVERVFVLDAEGAITSSIPIETMVGATMGMGDLAVEERDGGGRLLIVDMNGRVLRSDIGPSGLSAAEVYSSIPLPYSAGGWHTSMPLGIVMAPDGSALLYDTAEIPGVTRLWRVPPGGGEPAIWFEDPRLSGVASWGLRFGPDNLLYFVAGLSGAPEHAARSVVFRLPLVDHPRADDLEEFHRFEPGVLATGLAFAASGNLYVSLFLGDQLAVLAPDGQEIRRITSPLFDNPLALAFDAGGLLVTNVDAWPPITHVDPSRWTVSRVCTGELGLPLESNTLRPALRDHSHSNS